MPWPYGPEECPRCCYVERLEPPAYDDVGYEIVGLCRHPRIAMVLFVLQQRDPAELATCPCFSQKEQAA
jgi:hypothetical protein